MGRGGALRPGAVVPALLIAVAAVGCANPGDGPGDGPGGSGAAPTAAASSATASSAAPRPMSRAESCESAVGYWAREMLDGHEPYGDYQSMGLSNRQYDVLREVLATARATRRDQGVRPARELMTRRIRQACAEAYRDGGPSDGPWQ
ncbi:hypothetical protein [Streptomyces sp. AC512_CC834]|uniref:hypothetical protein n=1 Tax=Streptomyces sp. AC512_CC834 TaxID=2823691 RepID=UPI001C253F06|nr:hypothetical protein [Streptomyces sp. AC512_CC834]